MNAKSKLVSTLTTLYDKHSVKSGGAERLAALNTLLNMDEKGDDALGMDDAHCRALLSKRFRLI